MTTPTDDELCYLPAVEALALFRARRLSPVELLDAVIARAERVEPAINAFAFTYYDEARAAARRSEARYAKTGHRLRALEGLPIAVKNEMDLKGKVTDNGSLYLEGRVGTETHFSVERLLRAGAIVHARTNAPEFSCAGVCNSRLHGVTGTPWNPAFTAGGSSGGAGAALAAGTTPLATGSDIGGSIRIPAAACGVVGFKPPHGRNPDNTAFAYDAYAALGPMARTVADAALMQNVMCGPHPLDNASLRPRYRLPLEPAGIEGWKIAYSIDLGFFEIEEGVRRNTLAALDALRDLGATVDEVEVGWDEEADRAAQNYLDHLFNGMIAAWVDSDPSKASGWATYCADQHRKVGVAAFMHAYDVQMRWGRRLGRVLDQHHVFVCPALGSHHIPADHQPDQPVIVNGRSVDVLYGWSLAHPFNMMGRCPVLSVPSGLADDGLPTGIQIVARQYDDARVFRLGAALEAVRPWLDRPERRPTL